VRKILVKSTPEIDLKTGRVKVHSNGYKLLDEGPTDYVESGKEAKPEINPKTGRVKVHAKGYKLQNDASDRSRAYKIGEVTPTTNSPPISCHDRADREDILVSIASTFYAQLLRETFMRSFYTCRSQKHKNIVRLSVFFPNFINGLQAAFVCTDSKCSKRTIKSLAILCERKSCA